MIQNATWKLKDIFLVTFFTVIVTVLFYISTLALFGDHKWNFILSRYVWSILMIASPIVWIKIKYGLSKQALGMTVNNIDMMKYTAIGLTVAILYTLFHYYVFLKTGATSSKLIDKYSYLDLILMPISISGFASIVLAPIGEEIMVRGFWYGYLRTKLGSVIGIILQALFFSFLHYNIFRGNLNSVSQTFIIGLLLGTLYEKSRSLYPSIISHGIINYLIIIVTVIRK